MADKHDGYAYVGALKDSEKEVDGGSLWMHLSCGQAVPFAGFEAHAKFHAALADLFEQVAASMDSGRES